jgi:predicted PhzF superfamily epimerase YddE/YHI9
MKHRFTLVDVFTKQAFGGNQLPFFPTARASPIR